MIKITYRDFNDESPYGVDAAVAVDDEASVREILHAVMKITKIAGYHNESYDYIIEEFLKEKEYNPDYTFESFLDDCVYPF